MGYDAEGQVLIPSEDFWQFVGKYLPNPNGAEILFGVPRMDKEGIDMVVSYALSTICHPIDWAVKSKADEEWKDYKKTGVLKIV